MNRKMNIISDALDGINESFITEAAEERGRADSKRAGRRRMLGAAVAASVVITVTVILAALGSGFLSEAPSGSSPPLDGDSNSGNGQGGGGSVGENGLLDFYGALYLKVLGAYITDDGKSAVTIELTGIEGNSEAFIRSAEDYPNEQIERIVTRDGVVITKDTAGVFTLDFTRLQRYSYVDIIYSGNIFAEPLPDTGGDRGDESYDSDVYDTPEAESPALHFELSPFTPDGGYRRISCYYDPSSVSTERPTADFGFAEDLASAAEAVGFDALLGFGDSEPIEIGYRRTDSLAEVSYHFGGELGLSIRALEYYTPDRRYTLESFSSSSGEFDSDLYPLATVTNRESDGWEYYLHECYKNDSEFSSSIALFHYTENRHSIFFIVQFDLFGDMAGSEVKLLVDELYLTGGTREEE